MHFNWNILNFNRLINKVTGNVIWRNTSKRTKLLRFSIFLSCAIKSASILLSLVVIPLTINYLNPSEYGVWLTLSSIMVWIGYFDIGLGNGARNRLVEAFAVGDNKKAKTIISTTFLLISLLMGSFFLIFYFTNIYLDWSAILNIPGLNNISFQRTVLCVFAAFGLQFIFKNTGILFIAFQKPYVNDLILFLSNLLSFLLILFFREIKPQGNLDIVALIFSFSPALVYIISFIYVFWGKLSYLRPSWSCVDLSITRSLLGLGFQFFIIQIMNCVILYTSTNFIITHVVDSYSVTVYNISYKYFQIVTMGFNILLVPYWSSVTDAYSKKDNAWLYSSFHRLLKIYLFVILAVIGMFLGSSFFYELWIGHSVDIPMSVSFVMAIYVLLYNWSNLSIYFVNGFGKIRIQLIISIFSATIYIPLAIFLGEKYGLVGVLIASCISVTPLSIVMPIQVYKIIKNKATGLWNQ